MPLYMQTQNNTGSCWVVINEVRFVVCVCVCLLFASCDVLNTAVPLCASTQGVEGLRGVIQVSNALW